MSSMQKFIESCLLAAGKTIEAERKKGLSIRIKGRNDWASSADMASEKQIVGRIRKGYPDSTVLSEESYLGSDLNADSLFVLDPIDGTHNFIAGIPLYGISLAHYSNGRPTAGGIYLVPQKEMFYAEKGKPSTMNGRKISVSRTSKAEDFFFLCDSRIDIIEKQGSLPAVIRIVAMSQHTRFLGVAVHNLGYVACGKVDASMEFKLKPYDFAAGTFIVEQAGGTVTDHEGKRWGLETKRFLSSNGRQHRRILNMLNGRE